MTLHSPLNVSSGTSLAIGRAVVHGTLRRERLTAALARAPLDGLGLGKDEYLIVPHLAMKEKLQYGESYAGYAGAVSKRLRNHLEKAELNPVLGPLGSKALRFSTKAKLALWLIAEYGRGSSTLPPAIQLVTGTPTISHWWQRELLVNAPLLVHTAAALFTRNMLGDWIGRLSDQDIETAHRSIATSYGCGTEFTAVCVSPSLRSDLPPEIDTDGFPSSRLPESKQQLSSEAAALLPSLATAIANDPALFGLDEQRQSLTATMLYLSYHPSASRAQPMRAFTRKFLAVLKTSTIKTAMPISDFGEKPDLKSHRKAQDSFDDSMATSSSGKADDLNPPETIAPSTPPQLLGQKEPPRDFTKHDKITITDIKAQPDHLRAQPNDANERHKLAGNELQFDSSYCGLLFLVNPLIQFGFCRDFGLFEDDAMDLSPFATINALGCHWFGNRYRSDPLRGLLSKSHQPARKDRYFTIPRPQIFDFADRNLKLTRDRRHLTLWHPDGVPLLDLPTNSARRKMRAAAKRINIETLPARWVHSQKPYRLPQSSSRRWTAALARLLEWQLGSAIPGHPLTIEQLCLPGMMAINEGAIAVEIALEDLPFAVRIAGLDRDPGWLMKEGRALAFNFI